MVGWFWRRVNVGVAGFEPAESGGGGETRTHISRMQTEFPAIERSPQIEIAGEVGVEPTLADLETAVLPKHFSPERG